MGKNDIKDTVELERREKEKEEAKKKREKPSEKKVDDSVRGIVRVAYSDLDGTKQVSQALLKVKGIGKTLTVGVSRAAGLTGREILGSLSDESVKKLEEVVSGLQNFGFPKFMVNRRFDPNTGDSRHIIGPDLIIQKKLDVDALRKIRAYRGIRHELRLPVRGQRTRSSFRTGDRVGVVKKKAQPAVKKK